MPGNNDLQVGQFFVFDSSSDGFSEIVYEITAINGSALNLKVAYAPPSHAHLLGAIYDNQDTTYWSIPVVVVDGVSAIADRRLKKILKSQPHRLTKIFT